MGTAMGTTIVLVGNPQDGRGNHDCIFTKQLERVMAKLVAGSK